MIYKVSAANLKTLQLNDQDPIASVLQNVAVILATPKGSVPMYRDFGLPQDFVDRPATVAKPMICAAVKEAIEAYEPRAQILNVSFSENHASGQLIPIVEVEIVNE